MLPRLVWTIPVVLLHYGSLGTAQQRARAQRSVAVHHHVHPAAEQQQQAQAGEGDIDYRGDPERAGMGGVTDHRGERLEAAVIVYRHTKGPVPRPAVKPANTARVEAILTASNLN